MSEVRGPDPWAGGPWRAGRLRRAAAGPPAGGDRAPVLHVAATMPAWPGWPRRSPSSRPRVEVLRFPAWDCLPYDRVSPNPALVSERVATLTALLEPADAAAIVLTTVNALVQSVPPRAAFAGASHGAAGNGRPVKPEELTALPGSQRLWPRRHRDGAGRVRHARRHHRHLPGRRVGSGAARPVRRHDREHQAVRPGTQRSAGSASGCGCGRSPRCRWTRPRSPVSAPAGASCSARHAAEDPLYLSVCDGRRHPGMEHWAAAVP